MLNELLLKCEQHDCNAALEIIAKFDPLLKKYGNRLKYIDGYNELRYELLKILFSFKFKRFYFETDDKISAYLSTIVINKYNKLQRQEINKVYREMNDEYIDYFENIEYNYAEITTLKTAINNLPIELKETVKLRYIDDLKMNEIEKKLGITRQAIKKRLNKAKEILQNETFL